MILAVSLVSLLAASAAGQSVSTLPEYMIGDYVLETSNGFDDYMWELGVNWFTRKVGGVLNQSPYFPVHLLPYQTLLIAELSYIVGACAHGGVLAW